MARDRSLGADDDHRAVCRAPPGGRGFIAEALQPDDELDDFAQHEVDDAEEGSHHDADRQYDESQVASLITRRPGYFPQLAPRFLPPHPRALGRGLRPAARRHDLTVLSHGCVRTFTAISS